MEHKTEPIIELELYLVRHAQSKCNVSNGYGERKREELTLMEREDPELTEFGQHQAELLGERFKNYAFDYILSSALLRTLSTAYQVVKNQPEGGAKEIEIYPMLTESGLKYEYEGLSLSQLQKRFPVKLAQGVQATRLILGSEGKDDNWNLDRANKVLEYIHERFHNGEKVLITAHGTFNTSLFLSALNLKPDVGFDPEFINSSVTKFVFYKKGTGKFGDDIRLSYSNDLSHLYAHYPNLGLITI